MRQYVDKRPQLDWDIIDTEWVLIMAFVNMLAVDRRKRAQA